jgi:hypothetical protein
MSFVRGLPTFALLTIALSAAAQSPQTGSTGQGASESTAQLIGVQAEISQLQQLSGSGATGDRWRVLWLHQQIFEKVTAASLQLDATIAQIDNEIARANEVRGYLSDRRDRAVSRANLFSSIVGGAVGATSSGLQLSSGLTRPAAAVGIGAGSLSVGFAAAGIHAQPGKSSRFDFESNMLAEFFDRPVLPNSEYPATVWTFLNEASQHGPASFTRRQELMQTWVAVQRIDSLASTAKIDRVTSQPSELLKLSIDDFEDRAAMLQDVRARISYLKRDLGSLLASLPAVADAP